MWIVERYYEMVKNILEKFMLRIRYGFVRGKILIWMDMVGWLIIFLCIFFDGKYKILIKFICKMYFFFLGIFIWWEICFWIKWNLGFVENIYVICLYYKMGVLIFIYVYSLIFVLSFFLS